MTWQPTTTLRVCPDHGVCWHDKDADCWLSEGRPCPTSTVHVFRCSAAFTWSSDDPQPEFTV